MEYKEKYIKYKNKYLLLKKIQKQIGGLIKGDDILKKIKSIGFEIESSDISPIILDNTPVGLLGSKLDLERNTHFKSYGFNSISGSIIKVPIHKIFDLDDNCDILATQDSYILSEQIILKKKGNIEDLDVGYIITDYLSNNKPITTLNKNILLIEQNDDSTYGSFEFIITYRSIQSDKNLIYNKMIKIYNFLDNFFKSCTIIDDFTININDNNYKYYIYKNDNIYFMSSLPKIELDIIQFTPQITLGINIEDINLIYEYLANDYSDFENNSLKNKLTDLEEILENIFEIFMNFGYIGNFILLIYFFLNVDDTTSYIYDNDIIGINRNSISLKIRHKFSDIFNKLSINPEYSQEFSNFIDFIQQESTQIKIREYRINKINNLIATKIFELFTPSQQSRKFNAQIILLKNSNKLWDNFTPDEIKQIKDKIKEKYPDSIFKYDNIDEILQRIINADYQFLTGNDRQNDSIVSGGTLFPYEENILIELRYIHNKNTIFQTISNTIEHLNKINLEYIEEQEEQEQRQRHSYHSEDDDSMENDDSMDDDD